MCTMYWTIKDVRLKCPKCKKISMWELQTHFMGEAGSCLNYYKLGEKVWELKGIEFATLGGENDSFIGDCPHCNEYINFGAKIKDETIVKIFQLPKEI